MGGAGMGDGGWVGLDVHAASVVAALIEQGTGEFRVLRVPHRTPELVGWRAGLPGGPWRAHPSARARAGR